MKLRLTINKKAHNKLTELFIEEFVKVQCQQINQGLHPDLENIESFYNRLKDQMGILRTTVPASIASGQVELTLYNISYKNRRIIRIRKPNNYNDTDIVIISEQIEEEQEA